jgi:hypothetical protein
MTVIPFPPGPEPAPRSLRKELALRAPHKPRMERLREYFSLPHALTKCRSMLRQRLAKALVSSGSTRPYFAKRIPGSMIARIHGASWKLKPHGPLPAFPECEGKSLLDLAHVLSGTSHGDAAVQILEAATGEAFDLRTRNEIARAVDAFYVHSSHREKGRANAAAPIN